MTREKAIQVLQEKIDNSPLFKDEREAYDMAIEALSADGVGRYENAIQKLREMPKYLNGVKAKQIKKISADSVQGEWKHTITGQPYCSNCEYVFGEDEEFSPFWDYCPMCGARMKGGAE